MKEYSTLQDVKKVREKVKELFFEDIKLINLRSQADNALLQIEEILKEKMTSLNTEMNKEWE